MVTQLYYIELILTNDPNSEWILIKLNSEPASDCQRFAAWDEERLPCTELTCDFDPHCKASLPAGSAQVWLLQRAIGWRRKCSLPSFPSTGRPWTPAMRTQVNQRQMGTCASWENCIAPFRETEAELTCLPPSARESPADEQLKPEDNEVPIARGRIGNQPWSQGSAPLLSQSGGRATFSTLLPNKTQLTPWGSHVVQVQKFCHIHIHKKPLSHFAFKWKQILPLKVL
jgi:hypothetical protein